MKNRFKKKLVCKVVIEVDNRHLKKYGNSISDIYTIYKNKKLFGNNLETGLGHKGLADSQIEHIFERVVFNLIQKHNGYICILPYSVATIHKTKYLENII